MPPFSADVFLLLVETNVDLGETNVGKKATALLGLNYFRYNQKLITIITLLMFPFLTEFPFSKWTFEKKKIDCLPLPRAGVYEDRLVAMCVGRKKHRGGDEIYGESIYTKRELMEVTTAVSGEN
jgi:outer membrane receptor for ferrienterochelin and colicins